MSATHPNPVAGAPADLPGRRWIRACTLAELPEDEGLRLSTVPVTSVFATESGIFCIDDTCTHDTSSLADGWIEGCVVECVLHMARFDLRTGDVVSPPARRPVSTHPVACVDGVVLVALPAAYLVKEQSP